MTLLQTSKQLSSSLDPEEVIYNIAKEVKDLINATECTVFLVDSDGRYLEPIISLTKYPEEVMKMRLKIGEGVTGYVAKTGIAEYVNKKDPRAIHVPGTPDEDLALLSVPLISREEVIGVMTATKYDGGFSNWDLRLVSLFTTQVAGLIENARLIDRILSTMTIAEEHRRKLNSIFTSISDGMVVTDTDLSITEVNRAAELLLGTSEDDLIGAQLTDYFKDADFVRICEELVEGKELSAPREVELTWRETGGSIKHFLINIDILRDAQGQNSGLISTMRDVTEVKELDLLKDNFIANISHELRTPLTSIIGSAELVIEETDDKQPHHQFVKIIEKEAHRLRSLVDSILDFSLLETGSIELNPEFVNLNYLCEELVYRYRPIAEDKGVSLYFTPYSNLKMAQIDQRLIESAVANLIKNGIQFNTDGGWVKLATEQDDFWITLTVSDNGEGIPQERLEYVFDKFYQIDGSSTRSVGGTGLGLSLVKESIDAHGGKIEVRSEPDEGTHFTIYLPKEGISEYREGDLVDMETR
ncbi:MAG: PAS domain S-box protein [bacterium]|nr:PAS domain S-box protein [bacterium]